VPNSRERPQSADIAARPSLRRTGFCRVSRSGSATWFHRETLRAPSAPRPSGSRSCSPSSPIPPPPCSTNLNDAADIHISTIEEVAPRLLRDHAGGTWTEREQHRARGVVMSSVRGRPFVAEASYNQQCLFVTLARRAGSRPAGTSRSQLGSASKSRSGNVGGNERSKTQGSADLR